MHLQDAAQALALVLGRIEDRGTRSDRTRVNAEERQSADERVGRNFERQRRERRLIGGRTGIILASLGVDALDILDVGRRRHIVDNRVKQHLDAFVAVCGAAQNGNDLIANGTLADCSLDLRSGDLLALEVLHHEILVKLGSGFPQRVVILLRLIHHIGRNFLVADILAKIVIVNLRTHGHQVDDAAERLLYADRKLDRHCVALESVLHHADNIEEVGAHDVHLVDERHTRHLIIISLMPNRFGLRLNAALGAENSDRTVQYAQRALHLDGEVNVARGVDDVDTVLRKLMLGARPVAGGCGRGDSDAALLLLFHPVHRSGTVVGIADLVVYTGVVQNTLGGSGFTGVDVRHDADISGSFQGIFSRHIALLSKRKTDRRLIAVVRECLVRFRHLVRILTLLHSAAQIVARVQDLAGQALAQRLLAAGAGILGNPAQAQGLTTLRTDFHRHLIGGAAYTTGLNFERRHDVLHRFRKDLQRFTSGFLTDDIKSTINDLLRNAFLAVQHDRVDQLGDKLRVVKRIGQNVSLRDITSSWHFASLLQKYLIS